MVSNQVKLVRFVKKQLFPAFFGSAGGVFNANYLFGDKNQIESKKKSVIISIIKSGLLCFMQQIIKNNTE